MKIIFNFLKLIALAILFFCLIAPVSMILRVMQFDLLNLKLSNSKESYWIKRDNVQSTKGFCSQMISK